MAAFSCKAARTLFLLHLFVLLKLLSRLGRFWFEVGCHESFSLTWFRGEPGKGKHGGKDVTEKEGDITM